ncbi:MAG TPA: hypothetical protein VFV47_12420 [Hyphomicrobiaceae bacterium]|nr:hypothetical protein [Hyphomicrobiaceae bacterium]
MAASYQFYLDSFKVTRNGTLIFVDEFNDGTPPPSAPNFSNGNSTSWLSLTGMTFEEVSGKLLLDGSNSINSEGVLPTSPTFSLLSAILQINMDDPLRGLRATDDFAIEGTFDYAVPDPLGAYGIRLTDRVPSQDKLGDDIIELVVRTGSDGVTRIQLRELDLVNDEVTYLGSYALTRKLPAFDQVRLWLEHDDANPGVVTAHFELLSNGVVVWNDQMAGWTASGQIFGTETPNDTTDDEIFTRPQFVAYEPDPAANPFNIMEGDSGSNKIAGARNDDAIYGYGGDDEISAVEGNDVIFAGSGNDLINGGRGADTMYGGTGDDSYVVDNLLDQVIENLDSGYDRVTSSVDFTLSDNVEELILAAKAISGTGNILANTISGNGSANILDGRVGADSLSGGRGDDVFVFRKGEANGDTILDFAGNGARTGDSIQLVGYGTGTVIQNAGGNNWVIIDGQDASQETITLANGASIDATDWVVIA